jgi:hypothetical protein
MLAWEEIDAGAWMNAEFLNPVEQRGTRVRTASAGLQSPSERGIPTP